MFSTIFPHLLAWALALLPAAPRHTQPPTASFYPEPQSILYDRRPARKLKRPTPPVVYNHFHHSAESVRRADAVWPTSDDLERSSDMETLNALLQKKGLCLQTAAIQRVPALDTPLPPSYRISPIALAREILCRSCVAQSILENCFTTKMPIVDLENSHSVEQLVQTTEKLSRKTGHRQLDELHILYAIILDYRMEMETFLLQSMPPKHYSAKYKSRLK